MKQNRIRNAALGAVVVGMALPAWATYSRVESMGKRADFFMDDISIFDNPANMNIFPNFLIGELGAFRAASGDTSANVRRNIDPENSWFGGIFSYSLSKNKESGNLYPQISLGGAFNRDDEEMTPLIPDMVDGNVVPDPATNFDGFLGMTLSNGGMLGSHVHVALQEGANQVNGSIPDAGDASNDINVYMLRGDIGLNWPVARNIDGELSVGLASISYGPPDIDPELSWTIKARAFSTLEIINGELVPILNYSVWQAPGRTYSKLHMGVGVNVSLDRGFFWLGVQGMFDENETAGISVDGLGRTVYSSTSAETRDETIRGGLISFGIERNVWWDWLVLRVGGQKEITYRDVTGTGGSYNYVHTNATNDGTADDHVGFGIGINVEEKLKVDATLAEDILYTFGNLLSGPSHHVISRISATYSF